MDCGGTRKTDSANIGRRKRTSRYRARGDRLIEVSSDLVTLLFYALVAPKTSFRLPTPAGISFRPRSGRESGIRRGFPQLTFN